MDSRFRAATLSVAAFAFMAFVAAAPAQAQMMADSPTWTVEARGGIAIPSGDVSDLPLDDTGPMVGLGVGYHLSPRFTFRVDGSGEFYTGTFESAPDLRFFHYNAGLGIDLISGEGPLDVTANVAGGATWWDSDLPAGAAASGDFQDTFLTANGGLKVGYDVGSSATVFAGGEYYYQFVDEEDTQRFADLFPELGEGIGSASSIPLYLGVKFTM